MTNPGESYSGQQIGAAWAMIAHGSDARFIPLATAAASPFRFRLLGFSRNESGISPTYITAHCSAATPPIASSYACIRVFHWWPAPPVGYDGPGLGRQGVPGEMQVVRSAMHNDDMTHCREDVVFATRHAA